MNYRRASETPSDYISFEICEWLCLTTITLRTLGEGSEGGSGCSAEEGSTPGCLSSWATAPYSPVMNFVTVCSYEARTIVRRPWNKNEWPCLLRKTWFVGTSARLQISTESVCWGPLVATLCPRPLSSKKTQTRGLRREVVIVIWGNKYKHWKLKM